MRAIVGRQESQGKITSLIKFLSQWKCDYGWKPVSCRESNGTLDWTNQFYLKSQLSDCFHRRIRMEPVASTVAAASRALRYLITHTQLAASLTDIEPAAAPSFVTPFLWRSFACVTARACVHFYSMWKWIVDNNDYCGLHKSKNERGDAAGWIRTRQTWPWIWIFSATCTCRRFILHWNRSSASTAKLFHSIAQRMPFFDYLNLIFWAVSNISLFRGGKSFLLKFAWPHSYEFWARASLKFDIARLTHMSLPSICYCDDLHLEKGRRRQPQE